MARYFLWPVVQDDKLRYSGIHKLGDMEFPLESVFVDVCLFFSAPWASLVTKHGGVSVHA